MRGLLSNIYGGNFSVSNNREKVALQKNCTPALKLLTRDIVSFTSNKAVSSSESEPYKKINDLAGQYLNHLRNSIEEGLNFLKAQINTLKVNIDDICGGAAGRAKIIPGEKPGEAAYQMDISKDPGKQFDAALHEGYHILQFENDSDQEYVKIQKMLVRNVSENSDLKETYDILSQIVVDDIFIPVFVRHTDRIKNNILGAMQKSNFQRINEILAGELFSHDENLLPPQLKKWFAGLKEDRYLKYIQSHANIEIKAHSFCMSKDPVPIIYGRNSINRNKVRDIVAIKIYQEIAQMAEEELNRRQARTMSDRVA